MTLTCSSSASVWQQQVAVAELVPQVARREGLGIGVVEHRTPGNGFEHREVRCFGFVPAGDKTVDGAYAALRSDDRVRPSFCRMNRPSTDDTPVCNVISATATPRRMSAVTRASLNGRAALGISALPGLSAKTVS